MKNFDALELAEPLARALADMGHTTPTPIQAQAIPPAMDGQDVMGIAQTGTGKTAGFTLPTLHHIFTDDREPPKRGARVLILAPTRELASQIGEAVRDYGRHMMNLSVSIVYGGVPIARQMKRLSGGNDVLVATPGRLIDLLDRKAIRLDEVEVLILDEADQMLDMGFIHALKKIVNVIPKDRQTLFFSATLAPKIKQLSKQFLDDPVHVSVTPANRTADKVTQIMYKLSRGSKQERLAVELLQPNVGRSLVFCRTKHGADRVVKKLAQVGIPAVAIHGNKNQNQRTRALEAFKSGAVNTLVATDVAARGIDIPDITHVFNFELPNVAEQYVHRIGRTARANASGIAISLVATEKDTDELNYLRDIEKLLKEKIPEGKNPTNMAEEVTKLRARKALPPPEKPQPDARKGRGKSKKKGRFSKDSKKTDGRGNRPQTEGRSDPSRAMPSDKTQKGPFADKPAKDLPSREGRSRKAPTRGGGKPKMSGGASATEPRGRKPEGRSADGKRPAPKHVGTSESRKPAPNKFGGRGPSKGPKGGKPGSSGSPKGKGGSRGGSGGRGKPSGHRG
ncbi:RNA helicase [Litorimonas cladophorae]|uniref:DEAD-box ATP-dependent RNA helicase RhpA n=1 Tax=Litorimonas cladophorae TaxID=1220491 RepID=A0A918KKL5_9PROT|nr:DEAD/DEAH box helicase [Litorimonas cladophorae]GGX65925.1 RNA helicase [Litorimonas cladophorae]